MIVCKLIIKNKLGLHARPASLFVQAASQFEAYLTVMKNGLEVNGKSIMGVMMLEAEQGSEITVKADGIDEELLIQAISELIENKFHEE